MFGRNVKRVCCHCNTTMGYKKGVESVSHGICLNCLKIQHPKVYKKMMIKDPWGHWKEWFHWLKGLIKL